MTAIYMGKYFARILNSYRTNATLIYIQIALVGCCVCVCCVLCSGVCAFSIHGESIKLLSFRYEVNVMRHAHGTLHICRTLAKQF